MTLGFELSDDRREALVVVLHSLEMPIDELRAVTKHLMLDETLSEALRYGDGLTPADFVRARKEVRKSLTPLLHPDVAALYEKIEEDPEWVDPYARSTRQIKLLLKCITGKNPTVIISAPAALPARRCPKHPSQELFDDGFCAACAVEQAQRDRQRQ